MTIKLYICILIRNDILCLFFKIEKLSSKNKREFLFKKIFYIPHLSNDHDIKYIE